MSDSSRYKRLKLLSEFREIIFWQKLNEQFIAYSPDSNYSSKLRDFCFDNSLYEKIISSELISDIPLLLVSFYVDYLFITIRSVKWLSVISKLESINIIPLNIEKAISDTFEKNRTQYNKKHNFALDVDGEDHNQLLSQFIDSYLEKKESIGHDFSTIITKLYDIKSESMLIIYKNYSGEFNTYYF